MSLSTYCLEYGRHVARFPCHRRRRAYAPTSNTAAHDNHEKINSWVSFSLYGYGAPQGTAWFLRHQKTPSRELKDLYWLPTFKINLTFV